jgi:hypothetical protein
MKKGNGVIYLRTGGTEEVLSLFQNVDRFNFFNS